MIKILVLLFAAILVFLSIWANLELDSLKHSEKASKVLIEKGKRTLTLLNGEKVLKRYQISLGKNPIGPKEQEGDNKTPEGIYIITEHKANSSFYRALRLSYPEKKDSELARSKGVKPGSDIMIHGMRNGYGLIGKLHLVSDWTAGCIAVTNLQIEEIWAATKDGTVVEIRP